MLATRTARWTAGVALVCVVIVLAGWFALVAPRRDEADALQAQAVAATTAADQLQVKLAQLKAQYAELPLRKVELAGILRQMPATAQVPDLLRSLTSMSTAAGVDLISVAPGSPAFQSVASPMPASSASPSASPSASVSAPTTTATATTPTTTANRVVSTPIVVTIAGDFLQTVIYLQKLQTQAPRAFLITGLQVAPVKPNTHRVNMVISGRIFSLPDAAESTTVGSGRGATTGSTPAAGAAGTGVVNATGREGSRAGTPASRIGNVDSLGQVTS